MTFQTEVFEGHFNITEEGVDALVKSLQTLLGVADKVTTSLGKITVKAPKVDTSGVDAAAKASEAASKKAQAEADKLAEKARKSAEAIADASKNVKILMDSNKSARESFLDSVDKTEEAVRNIAGAKSFKGLVDGALQAKDAVDSLNNTFSNVTAGLTLATRQGGNVFLGLRQAIFGTANSSNVLAKAFDFLGSSTLKTSNATDKLAQNAERITNQMSSFNQAMALSTVSLKQIAKEEGLSGSALNKLDVSIQKTGRGFKVLQDVIESTGTITPRQLANVRQETDLLLKQVQNLLNSGFAPVGKQTRQVLLQMEQQLLGNAQATKILTAQMRAIPDESKKMGQANKAIGDGLNQQISLIDRIKNAFAGLFGFATSGSQNAASSMGRFNSQLERSSSLSRIAEIAIGSFLGVTLQSLVSKAIGTLSSFFNFFGGKFIENGNLVQNFEITLRQMLTGLDTKVIDGALSNIDQFIRTVVAKTPFELADAMQSFQRLATAGLDPKKWLTPVADAAAAMNKPMEQLIGAFQRLQVGAKGIGIDMLRDFGIPVNQVGAYLDKVTGQTLTLDQVFKQNGDITKLNAEQLAAMGIEFRKLEFDKQGALVNDVSDAMTLLNGFLTQNTTFAGAAEGRSRSLTGVMSNLADTVSILAIEAGKPIFEILTTKGQGLLNFLGTLMPSLERLATTIGAGIATAIEYASNVFGNFATQSDGIVAAIERLNSFASAVFAGDWQEVWRVVYDAVDWAVVGIFDLLDSLVTNSFDWGVNFVVEIANGIIDAANTILTDAVNYIGDTIASFLAPGSPPEEGPLSSIDKWGQGVMQVFTDSMSNVDTRSIEGALSEVRNVFDRFDLASAQADVFATQQQIIAAEAQGFVPAELKKQLQLQQEKVELIRAQAQLQDQLNQEQKQGDKQAEQGGKSKGRGVDSSPKDRVAKEKLTAQQIRDNALSILDQQLKDGVISYEDYTKKRLSIEEKFYQDTLEEGGTVTQEQIANIKNFQAEVDKIAEAKKKKKDEGGGLVNIPTGRDILAGFADMPDKLGKIGEYGARTLTERFHGVVSKGFDDITATIAERFNQLGERVQQTQAFKSFQSTKEAIAGIFTTTAETVQGIFDGIGYAINRVVVNLKGFTTAFGLTAFVGFVGGLKPLLPLLGGLAKALAPLTAGLSGFIDTIALYGLVALDKLGVAISFLSQSAMPGIMAAVRVVLPLLGKLSLIGTLITIAFVGVSENVDLLADIFDDLVRRVSGTLGRLFQVIAKLFDIDLVSGPTGLGIILTVLGKIIKTLGKIISSTVPTIKGIFGGAFKVLYGIIQATILPAMDIVVGFLALLSGDSTIAAESFLAAFDSIKKAIPNLMTGIRDIIAKTLSFQFNFAGNIAESILDAIGLGQLGKLIGNRFRSIGTDIEVAVADIFNTISNLLTGRLSIKALFERIGLGTLGQFIETQLGGAFGRLVASFTTLGTVLDTQLGPAFQRVFSLISTIVSGAIATIQDRLTSLQPLFDYLGILLSKLGFNGQNSFDLLQIVVTTVVSTIVGVITLLTGVVVGLVEGITSAVNLITIGFNQLKTGIDTVILGTVATLTGFYQFFYNLFTGNFPAAIDGLKLAFNGMLVTAIGTFQTMSGLIITVLGPVVGFIEGFVTGIIGFFQDMYNQLVGESIIPDLVDSIIYYLETLATQGLLTISNWLTDAIAVFDKYYDKFAEIGGNLMKGLAEGIKKNMNKVLELLKDLAKQALRDMGLEWAIQSPSVRFMELGIQAIAGLNEGLAKKPIAIADLAKEAAFKAGNLMERTIDASKARFVAKQIRDIWVNNFAAISSGAVDADKLIRDTVLDKDNLRKLGIGDDQVNAVSRSITLFIDKFKQLKTEADTSFKTSQTDLLLDIQKTAEQTTSAFNNQVFNIRSSATEARIELEKLFNRTVSDEEVANLAKAFEGTPVDQMSEQQALIYRNYILQNKLAGATEQELKVREAIAKMGEQAQSVQDLMVKLGLAESPEQAQSAGNQIIEALGLGIDAGVDDVLNKLGDASQSIIDKIKAAFGIASPSKVAYGLGENISAGLAGGIKGGTKLVGRALDNLVSPGVALFSGGAGLNLGDTALQPTLAGGQSLQLIQYNTIGDQFDMATFTARTQMALNTLMRR